MALSRILEFWWFLLGIVVYELRMRLGGHRWTA